MWADFWGNKPRAILTILTIAVVVLAVGFSNSLGLFMTESMESDYLSARPSEATAYAHPLDDDSVKIAHEGAGAEVVEGLSIITANIIRAGEDDVIIQFAAIEKTEIARLQENVNANEPIDYHPHMILKAIMYVSAEKIFMRTRFEKITFVV